ncbi:DUF1735 domain-containing protein [Niabella sp. CJ426]|uniref:DUF1735 domain-containing protein n=1 Tax=Niabella sp. CJ426 TaxID=3393740 RepID=UPI003CFE88D2
MKKLNFLILAVVVFILQSCLKGRDMVLDPDQVKDVIEFGDISAPTSAATAPFRLFVPMTLDPEVSEVTLEAFVNFVGPNTAPEDITVSIGVDPAALARYNTSQNSSYNHLEVGAYEMPTTVLIKKGQRKGTFPIKLKTAQFDQLKNNALTLKITQASNGQTISGNFGTVIYSFPIKSIWDGTYTYTVKNDFGTIDGNNINFTETDIPLRTVGPNRVRMTNLWQTYSGYSEYQFNASNTNITEVLAFSGSLRASSINQVVVVDPVNHIFEIHWTGIGRGVKERFVRTGD